MLLVSDAGGQNLPARITTVWQYSVYRRALRMRIAVPRFFGAGIVRQFVIDMQKSECFFVDVFVNLFRVQWS